MRALAVASLVAVAGACRAPERVVEDAGPNDALARDLDVRDFAGCPIPEAASRQTVHLVVRNDTGADRYLVVSGSECTAIDVSNENRKALDLEAAFQCGCECMAPPRVFASGYRRLAAGESFSLPDWDARALAFCLLPLDCQGFGSADTVRESSSQPVAAGAYRASVAYEVSLRSDCMAVDASEWYCTGPRDAPLPWASGGQRQCPSTLTATVDLALPTAGDVTVTIPLTQ